MAQAAWKDMHGESVWDLNREYRKRGGSTPPRFTEGQAGIKPGPVPLFNRGAHMTEDELKKEIAVLKARVETLEKLLEKHGNLRVMWRTGYAQVQRQLALHGATHTCWPDDGGSLS